MAWAFLIIKILTQPFFMKNKEYERYIFINIIVNIFFLENLIIDL